jgi:tetratricopeptide (TPR) repeat protein
MRHEGDSRFLGLLSATGFALSILSIGGGLLYSLIARRQLPDPTETYDVEFEHLLGQQDYAAALPQLRLAAAVDFNSERRQWELLEAAQAVESRDDQQFALEALARFQPGNPDVHYWLAGVYLKQSDPQKAAAAASRAVRLNPENVNYLCRYGAALLGAGRMEEAAEQYRLALQIDPRCEPATLALEHPLKDY